MAEMERSLYLHTNRSEAFLLSTASRMYVVPASPTPIEYSHSIYTNSDSTCGGRGCIFRDESASLVVGHQQKQFRPGRMAPSESMRSVRAVSDTPVADDAAPAVNTTRRAAYRPPISVSSFHLALSVFYFKLTLWRCGQL